MRRPIRTGFQLSGGLVAMVAAVIFFTSCAERGPAEGALMDRSGAPLYQDGTYQVTGGAPGPDGWSVYLSMEVEASLITDVCFGAFRRDGTRLESDEIYLETFRLTTGERLIEFLRDLETQLLSNQQLPFDVRISSLDERVAWSSRFAVVADRALSLARSGNTPTVSIGEPGPYVVTDRPDETGWKARLAVAFRGDVVVAAGYQETREGPDGELSVRDSFEPLASDYERIYGLRPQQVAESLAAQLVGAPVPERIDGISSATVTTRRVESLINRVGEVREAIQLPNRLCDR